SNTRPSNIALYGGYNKNQTFLETVSACRETPERGEEKSLKKMKIRSLKTVSASKLPGEKSETKRKHPDEENLSFPQNPPE
ncbi:hypothetical protein BaRGS_00038448, partial [Batillaria attramentaria]